MVVEADICIIGGSLVGLTLANALADSHWTIAVIDQQPAPEANFSPVSYDLRVSAINHAAVAIFQSFNLWETIQQWRVSPFQQMYVWDAQSSAKIEFDCTEVSQPYLGHIVEHSVMKQALWSRLQSYENVQLFYATGLTNLGDLKTRLLVGADGANSWVAQQTGLTAKTRSYQQSALVTTVRCQQGYRQTAWQRFLATGPVALLPLADPQLASLVWSTTPEQAQQLQKMEVIDFNQQLTAAFEGSLASLGMTLGEMEAIDQRLVFSLQESHAINYVKPGVALIGDAAHTLHPLAGQGVNLGLLDATCLAQVLQEAAQKGRDFAHILNLRRYERWRKGENTLMIKAMEGFRRCFASTSPLAKKAREGAFVCTEKLPWLKAYFIRRAMGLQGDLPGRAVFYERI